MESKTGLDLLREPFSEAQISKLPKGTKAQNQCQASEKINCTVCGGWHHPNVIHLDYVGHAALTDRLLDADPLWTWEPFAVSEEGLPAFDKSGGLWIRLTVCGHTRLGYGHAASSEYKDIGSREKEVIGDALRNAAMRFGAALDLWHKGKLHIDDHEDEDTKKDKNPPEKTTTPPLVQKEDIPDFMSTAQGRIIDGLLKTLEVPEEALNMWLVSVKKPDLTKMSFEEAKTMIEKWNEFSSKVKVFWMNNKNKGE